MVSLTNINKNIYYLKRLYSIKNRLKYLVRFNHFNYCDKNTNENNCNYSGINTIKNFNKE